MYLYIIRHAHAEDRATFHKKNRDDHLRPLTKVGRSEFQKIAKGFSRLCPQLDVLATSPYRRAEQTAQILRRRYRRLKPVECKELIPTSTPSDFLKWLGRQKRYEHIAIVGHEPHLSGLIAFLLTRHKGGWLDLKKGSITAIEFVGAGRAKRAYLKWMLTPAQLRRL
jgi:phosphohistidine phosphatase